MINFARFSLLLFLVPIVATQVLDAQDFTRGQRVVAVKVAKMAHNDGTVSDSWIGMPVTVRGSRVHEEQSQTLVDYGFQAWIATDCLKTPEHALAFFDSELEKSPTDESFLHAKGITLGMLDRNEEAVECFDQLLSKEPDSVSYLNERATILVSLKEFERAEKDFSRIIELKPENAVFYCNRAICRRYFGNEKLDDARGDLDQAIKLNPKLIVAYRQKVEIELQAGNQEEALAAYDLMVKNNPETGQAYLLRSDLFMTLQKYQQALGDLEKYVSLVPQHFQPQMNRAILLRQLGRVEESQQVLDKLAELFPNQQAVFINRGVTYENMGKYDLAIADLNKAMELNEQHRPYLLFHRATAAIGKKDYASAIEDLNRVIELDPKTMAFVRRGEALFAVNQFDAALADFSKALELDESKHVARYHRAKIFEMQQKDDEALADYNFLVENGIATGPVLYARSHVLKRKKKWSDALIDQENAVKLVPKFVDYINDLAWSLATVPDESLRNPKKAIALATEACELSQWKRGLVMDTLATAHAANEDFEKAVEVIDRALQQEDAKDRKDLLDRKKMFQNRQPFIDK